MKVNLLINSRDVRSGYINIDPYAVPGDADRVQGSIWDLDDVADDGEVTDLIALDVIDYVGSEQADTVLSGWIGKLRHGATITVGGIDMHEVAHALISRKLGLVEANVLLYGWQQAPWDYRKSTFTIQHVIQFFREKGMKLERKHIHQYKYVITARRQ